MKTIYKLLAGAIIPLLYSPIAGAQTGESVFVNGKEVFMHRNENTSINSFLATQIDGQTYLVWVVENFNSEGSFLVYRSADGEHYEIIGIVNTQQSSAPKKTGYYFIDNKPLSLATSYYKVMHLATDNSFFTSDKITVRSRTLNFVNSNQQLINAVLHETE